MNKVVEKRIGRVGLRMEAVRMGEDYCLVVTGGDRPHLGAVALSTPRPSLADSRKISASTSVLTLVGHKEDDVAKKIAHQYAAKLNRQVVVACGVHLDGITKAELAVMEELLEDLAAQLLQKL